MTKTDLFYLLGLIQNSAVGLDALDDDVGEGLVVCVGLAGRYLVDYLHALHYLSEGGVITVKMGSGLLHDEKLAAGRVQRSGFSRHGQNSSVVLYVVFKAV